MKSTIELPEFTFRRVKAFAAPRGISMRQFFEDAVEQTFRGQAVAARADPHDAISRNTAQPPWMAGFGGLSHLGDEHRRVLDAIEDAFEGRSPAR